MLLHLVSDRTIRKTENKKIEMFTFKTIGFEKETSLEAIS